MQNAQSLNLVVVESSCDTAWSWKNVELLTMKSRVLFFLQECPGSTIPRLYC